MPIGGLFQRVSKLVHSSNNKNSSSNDEQGEGERRSRSTSSSATSSRRQSHAVVDNESPRHEVGNDDQQHQQQHKRPSAELSSSRSSSTSLQRKDEAALSNAHKRKIPSISTSTSHLQQPTFSVTPATPVTPTKSSSSSSVKLKDVNKQGNDDDSSSTRTSFANGKESPKRAVERDEKQCDGDAEKQSGGSNRESSHSSPASSPPIRRIPSQPILKAGDNQSSSLEDSVDEGASGVVLAEPMQMSEEEELRLMKNEEDEKISAEKEREARLKEGDHNKPKEQQEDNPSMPPPSSSTSSRHPHLGRALDHINNVNVPKKPSILSRLPSQVISESPGSEYPPSPGGSDAFPSRKSSIRSTGFQPMTSKFTETPLLADPSQVREMAEDDSSHIGSHHHHPHQRHHHHPHHLPHLLADAVHDLHNKLAKPNTASSNTTDYQFPNTPVSLTADVIKEEESIKSPRSESERENTLDSINSSSNYSSPPSSAFLEPGHRTLSPGDSREPSVSSLSSINEFSTPAGFLKHRRSSSQNAPREVKETYNAGYKDLPDGKRKLNQYILTGDIGRGSFGLVQIAKDEQTGQEYAVKEFSKMRLRKRQQSEMIRRQAKGSRRGAVPIRGKQDSQRTASNSIETGKKDLDLIRSEVAIMKKLDHPNVVKLYEVLDVEQDDSLFMVVELCKNGPILNIGMGQSTEPMSEDTARNFFRQMILAIEYLHENGIIHRDIKPENILKMSDDMSIKLVDFGVSEMFSKEEEQRELRTGGSPAFMAPELCMSGHTKVSGKAADIWALGVTLYCMVVGHLPFESNLMLDLYDKIKNDPVNMPEDLTVALRELIVGMLEKDPAKRLRMPQLREHRWVTCDGRDPLPSTEMNVTSVEEVTENDIDNAIAVPSVSYIVNAVRAANRWRRFAARRTQSEGARSLDAASSISTDMSRSGSFEGGNGGPSRKNSGASTTFSPDAAGLASGSGSALASSEVIQESPTESEEASTRATNHAPPAQSPTTSATETVIGEDGRSIYAEPEEDDESDNRGGKFTQSDLKSIASFPLFSGQSASKRPPYEPSESSRGSRRSIKTSVDSIVDFPEIDRAASQQEHLRETGIDDSTVEVLRHYEDVTGHMLPRSAVEEVVRSRKNSPLPTLDPPTQHTKSSSA